MPKEEATTGGCARRPPGDKHTRARQARSSGPPPPVPDVQEGGGAALGVRIPRVEDGVVAAPVGAQRLQGGAGRAQHQADLGAVGLHVRLVDLRARDVKGMGRQAGRCQLRRQEM